MKKEEKPITATKTEIPRTQKGLYMADKIWDVVEKQAEKHDRSSNYIIEKALKSYFNISNLNP